MEKPRDCDFKLLKMFVQFLSAVQRHFCVRYLFSFKSTCTMAT